MHNSSFISLLKFVSINEGKLVALLVYSSFIRIATRTLRRIAAFTSSSSQVRKTDLEGGVNTVSLRIQYNSTARWLE